MIQQTKERTNRVCNPMPKPIYSTSSIKLSVSRNSPLTATFSDPTGITEHAIAIAAVKQSNQPGPSNSQHLNRQHQQLHFCHERYYQHHSLQLYFRFLPRPYFQDHSNRVWSWASFVEVGLSRDHLAKQVSFVPMSLH